MDKNALTAQELLNTCVLKYSLVKASPSPSDNLAYNFSSSLSFFGYVARVYDTRFQIVNNFEYKAGETEIYCSGWQTFTDLKPAYRHLDKLQKDLARCEKLYKTHLERKRLKKIKNDF